MSIYMTYYLIVEAFRIVVYLFLVVMFQCVNCHWLLYILTIIIMPNKYVIYECNILTHDFYHRLMLENIVHYITTITRGMSYMSVTGDDQHIFSLFNWFWLVFSLGRIFGAPYSFRIFGASYSFIKCSMTVIEL